MPIIFDSSSNKYLMGPIIIFDKSALQCLNPDESCWLERFFTTNLIPIFYAETLADLDKKKIKGNKTPEQIVSNLAYKVPTTNIYPNLHHDVLVLGDLLGESVDLTQKPIIKIGDFRYSTHYGNGIRYKQFSEQEAFSHWRKQEFLTIEKNFAKKWRTDLYNFDLQSKLALIKHISPQINKFKKLTEVIEFINQLLETSNEEIFHLALEILDIPESSKKTIFTRWKILDFPSFDSFASYAAYKFRVDIFFMLCVRDGLISAERVSNKVDFSYLYYLPFTMIFTSRDHLHSEIAPLFMKASQSFIEADLLKKALVIIDNHYSKLSEQQKAQGILKFASYPPGLSTIIEKLWDKHCPGWLEKKRNMNEHPSSNEERKYLLEQLVSTNNISNSTFNEPEFIVFERDVLRKKGKWYILPADHP